MMTRIYLNLYGNFNESDLSQFINISCNDFKSSGSLNPNGIERDESRAQYNFFEGESDDLYDVFEEQELELKNTLSELVLLKSKKNIYSSLNIVIFIQESSENFPALGLNTGILEMLVKSNTVFDVDVC